MVDDRGKLLLIEVNTQPALGRHGHVLQEMMPRMIEEVVQKAIDPLFPPPASAAATAPEVSPNHKQLVIMGRGELARRRDFLRDEF